MLRRTSAALLKRTPFVLLVLATIAVTAAWVLSMIKPIHATMQFLGENVALDLTPGVLTVDNQPEVKAELAAIAQREAKFWNQRFAVSHRRPEPPVRYMPVPADEPKGTRNLVYTYSIEDLQAQENERYDRKRKEYEARLSEWKTEWSTLIQVSTTPIVVPWNKNIRVDLIAAGALGSLSLAVLLPRYLALRKRKSFGFPVAEPLQSAEPVSISWMSRSALR